MLNERVRRDGEVVPTPGNIWHYVGRRTAPHIWWVETRGAATYATVRKTTQAPTTKNYPFQKGNNEEVENPGLEGEEIGL